MVTNYNYRGQQKSKIQMYYDFYFNDHYKERTVSFSAFSPRKSDLHADAHEGTKNMDLCKRSSGHMPLRRTITGWAYDASRQMIKISRALWNRTTFTIREENLRIRNGYGLFKMLSNEDIEELAQLPMDNPTNDEMGKLVESAMKSHAQSHIVRLTPSPSLKRIVRTKRVRFIRG
ncbi:hypothetical protein QVD17_35261 [Tagetes erecta]|uniref:Uncharacterized protein n=1 Tax=Tagetes erecta TaxID=13708 RepID=A0AAD8K398_TARER|nr:hypothetical protein QVD17_35261 [Tagetes erecta]